MDTDAAKEFKELREQNACLKKQLAEAEPEKGGREGRSYRCQVLREDSTDVATPGTDTRHWALGTGHWALGDLTSAEYAAACRCTHSPMACDIN